jgi:hypothetical protein
MHLLHILCSFSLSFFEPLSPAEVVWLSTSEFGTQLSRHLFQYSF